MPYKIDWNNETIIYTNEHSVHTFKNFSDAKNVMIKAIKQEILDSINLYQYIKDLTATDVKNVNAKMLEKWFNL